MRLSSSRPLFLRVNFDVRADGVCAFNESGKAEESMSNRIPTERAIEKMFFNAYLSTVRGDECLNENSDDREKTRSSYGDQGQPAFADKVSAAQTAAPMTPTSSPAEMTSMALPCNGVILTIC